MIVIHDSGELCTHKDSIPPSVYDFLVRQFALLEDDDPQMGVYGNPDFLCSTGTIGVIFSEDELEGLDILEEMVLSNGVRIFTCMDGSLPMDVIYFSDLYK